MNLVDDYANMFGSIDFTSLIVSAILGMAVFFIISGIIKYKMNIWMMKKAVKEALREIEEEKKLTQSNENKIEDNKKDTK